MSFQRGRADPVVDVQGTCDARFGSANCRNSSLGNERARAHRRQHRVNGWRCWATSRQGRARTTRITTHGPTPAQPRSTTKTVTGRGHDLADRAMAQLRSTPDATRNCRIRRARHEGAHRVSILNLQGAGFRDALVAAGTCTARIPGPAGIDEGGHPAATGAALVARANRARRREFVPHVTTRAKTSSLS